MLIGADYRIADTLASARVDIPAAGGTTLVAGLLGWGLVALLERITRYGIRIWTAIALLVVAASEVPVFLVEATSPTRVALFVLHLVVGSLIIPTLVRARS